MRFQGVGDEVKDYLEDDSSRLPRIYPPQRHDSSDQTRAKLMSNLARLDDLKQGHGAEEYTLLIGLPFPISKEQYSGIQSMGQRFVELLTVSNNLYTESLSTPGLALKVLDGGLTEKAKECQHRLYEIGPVKLPTFFRVDMLDVDKAVELNIPGSGFGLMQTINSVCLPRTTFGTGLVAGFVDGLRKISGKNNPRVAFPLHGEGERNNLEHFVKQLISRGIRAKIYNSKPPELSDVDVLFRFNLNYAVNQQGWEDYFKAYLRGDIIIEPPPTTVYDSKGAQILPYHPDTRERFSDAVRSIFPRTYLAEEGAEVTTTGTSSRTVKMEEIPHLPASERRFVIKYGGNHGKLLGGGWGVQKLDVKGQGEYSAEKLMTRALSDWREKSEPWLIQERIRRDFDVTFLQDGELKKDKMRARIMPFNRIIDGNPEIIGGSALFSINWKVHGQPDSVHCAIKVE